MRKLDASLESAIQAAALSPSAVENIRAFFHSPSSEAWARESVAQLIEAAEWNELNDRFYTVLKFGTGGLRGRTIGKTITAAERGSHPAPARPEFPAAGSAVMNDALVTKATKAVVRYAAKCFVGQQPRLVIACDTRHFSPEFSQAAAEAAAAEGTEVFLFDGPTPTPELSFAVRDLKAHAGVMLTASHNPYHDNGYKIYFSDGGQIVEPHASGIFAEMQSIDSLQMPSPFTGSITTIGAAIDEKYSAALRDLVINPQLLAQQQGKLKLVFTPLHGTGIRIVPKVLSSLGFPPILVEEQCTQDGNFPTVKSPNPENPEAFIIASRLAKSIQADAVFGTDPDADRMGLLVPDSSGELVTLSGNQIGVLMASYRIDQLFRCGVVNAENASRAAIIKTFVTTGLLRVMAEAKGMKCIDTLTGFKHIGTKLLEYEQKAGGRKPGLSGIEWRDQLLKQSTYCVFASEESFGYLATDFVRDKDANAATVMLLETLAYAKSTGVSLLEFLDSIYVQHGFYAERLQTITMEGEAGSRKIKKLLDSYESAPPKMYGNIPVTGVRNFAKDHFTDADGRVIPAELMLIFDLEGGTSIAVRGSGTEPKIKYYYMAQQPVASRDQLSEVKAAVNAQLDAFSKITLTDVEARLA